jgi:hypothetical protein
MTSIELLARLAALLPPPRYPLTRYHGVLAPRSAWRREIIPRAPANSLGGGAAVAANRRCSPSPSAGARDRPVDKRPGSRSRTTGGGSDGERSLRRPAPIESSPTPAGEPHSVVRSSAEIAPSSAVALGRGEVPETERLTPNILGVRHWSRLLGGLLYATSPRLSWPLLLRRTFDIDILDCAKCHGRLRVVATIADTREARRILERLGVPSDAPQAARARDPTYLNDEQHASS